jgi:YgiT-type zinc finger domain-containing protein
MLIYFFNKKANKMRKNNWKKPQAVKKCPNCGAPMKKRTRTNYPFGKKSKATQTNYFKCVRCGEKN